MKEKSCFQKNFDLDSKMDMIKQNLPTSMWKVRELVDKDWLILTEIKDQRKIILYKRSADNMNNYFNKNTSRKF